MSRQISLLATAVGSLPHTHKQDAIDLIASQMPSFPVWPQLPNINQKEDMIGQFSENIPGIVFEESECRWYMDQNTDDFFEKLEEFFLDYESIINEKNYSLLEKYAISDEFASALPVYFAKIKEIQPIAVKGQITGPFTFGTSIVDRDKKCAFYDETLKEILIKALTLKALWQVIKFKELSPNSIPVIFMDEPSISQYGTSSFITITKKDVISYVNEISEVLQDNGALVGIHCCGKTDWSLILDSKVNILNFDALCFAESLSLFSKEVENFLKNKGYIAWGLVPTLDAEALKSATVDNLLEKFEKAKSFLVNKGIDEKLIIESSFITPTCGAGSLSLDLARKAMELNSKLAKALTEKYSKKV